MTNLRRVAGASISASFVLALASLGALGAAGCDSSTPAPRQSDGGSTPPSGWRSVVGASGFFGQTFDDVRWNAKSLRSESLYAVACVGNLVGWATGDDGTIGHTTDGGATWSWQSSGVTGKKLFALRFVDTTHGVAGGEGGALVVTSDGGLTWRSIDGLGNVTTTTWRGAAAAADVRTLFVVGDGGALVRSTDAGATWAHVEGLGNEDLRAVASDPGAHLVLVADAAGSVWSSTDRGASFHVETTAGERLDAVSVSENGGVAIAAGAHGTAIARSASGEWHPIDVGTKVDLHAALIAGEATYVAGEEGTLVTTHDASLANGSARWTVVPLGTKATLYGLEDL
jgi:photosystem II stability/assembly factor-like uncharacterized protein